MCENVVAAGATYQSAERVLALLASFEDGRPELSVTEIAAALGVHKSTASRLAATLERAGFLARSGKRYRLGVEVIRLGTWRCAAPTSSPPCSRPWKSCPSGPARRSTWPCPAGPDILNVAEVPSTYILSCSGGWIGRRTRPHAVANGKVLLAFGAIPLPRHLERYTEHTITSPDALEAELAAVRRGRLRHGGRRTRGGLVAVAAPVFGPGGGAASPRCPCPGPPTGCRPRQLDELGRLCADC